MIIVHTQSGKEFNCDMSAQHVDPPRLYLHLVDTSFADVVTAVTGENGLPFEEFPEYSFIQSISVTPIGVNLALKKTYI